MKHRDTRRLAMQALYQLDVNRAGDEPDRSELAEALDDEFDRSASVREAAVELALAAWRDRTNADEAVTALAPDWPSRRQPPVDRAILRLAYHELTTERVPHGVAINEAVELAKAYAAEQSPAFINGILDKLAKAIPTQTKDPSASPPAPEPQNATTWLDDAMSP